MKATRLSPRVPLSRPAFPSEAWPTETFVGDKDEVFFNGEAIEMIHAPAARADGDSLVFFRRSDVIAAGDLLDTDDYPAIRDRLLAMIKKGMTLEQVQAARPTLDYDPLYGAGFVGSEQRRLDNGYVLEPPEARSQSRKRFRGTSRGVI